MWNYTRWLAWALMVSAAGAAAAADAIPGKQEVLAVVRKVNAYQLTHPVIDKWEAANPGISPLHWPWPRATYYTGVMAVWKSTHDDSFLEQAVKWGRECHWGVSEEQLGANRLFPMQTWLEVYFVKKDPAMIEPSIKWLATPDPLYARGRPALVPRWPGKRPSHSLCGLPLWSPRARYAHPSYRRQEIFGHHECVLR